MRETNNKTNATEVTEVKVDATTSNEIFPIAKKIVEDVLVGIVNGVKPSKDELAQKHMKFSEWVSKECVTTALEYYTGKLNGYDSENWSYKTFVKIIDTIGTIFKDIDVDDSCEHWDKINDLQKNIAANLGIMDYLNYNIIRSNKDDASILDSFTSDDFASTNVDKDEYICYILNKLETNREKRKENILKILSIYAETDRYYEDIIKLLKN